MTRKLTFVAAVMAAMALFAFDINLETAGIVVRDPLNPNQARAAEELAKHLDLVSGRKPSTRLADFSNAVFAVGFPAPGKCAAGEFEALATVDGGKVYFWGDDGRCSGGKPCGGSLFAVYAFLDKVLGVKWVYPGDDGIVYCNRRRLSVDDDWTDRFMPPLLVSIMRGGAAWEASNPRAFRYMKYLPNAMRGTLAEERNRIAENREWMLRMRHQTRHQFKFGHAFTDWNRRYHKSHPEYLALNEKGERGSHIYTGDRSNFMKLCISNEAVVDQIVSDWKKGGMTKYLNICPNDGKGFCRCKACCALDMPLSPEEPFNLHKTDRYVDFWNRIAAKAVALRPDVVLCTYIYESYRWPPRREKIKYPDNMLFGMVPSQEDDNADMIAEWKKAGMKRFLLRPNYLCYRGVIPRGYERFYHRNFRMNIDSGMIGCDFDGAPRRVIDFESYVIARMIADPALSFEAIEAEFLAQFGAAAPIMREYFVRVRERTEKRLLEVQGKPQLERDWVPDDSQLYSTVMSSNNDGLFAEDMSILDRAVNVPGLTEVERRRVELRRIVCEHARRTHEFLLARDAKGKDEFGKIAMELLDYRINIHERLSDMWGTVFRAYPCEVWWWRRVPRHTITKAFPEMELND